MPEQRIKELEQQLLTANETVARLTLANTGLTSDLASAELQWKKLRRSSRRDESTLKDKLVTAQKGGRF